MKTSLPTMKCLKVKGLWTCLLSAGCALVLCNSFIPALAEESTMASSLTRLEDKYFQHDFSKEEPGERIERLEKLIYGEARTGSNEERLNMLLSLVPNLNSKAEEATPPAAAAVPPPVDTRSSQPRKTLKPDTPLPDSTRDTEPIPDDNSYPAVTAMEKKIFSRDFVGESIGKRLDRLEIKAFGKTSASEDLPDRVDRLKSTTGIDIARSKPANSEWADEDEDASMAGSQGIQPFTGLNTDDPVSQRNYRKQQQNSYSRPRPSFDPYAGTGTFGAGNSMPSGGGSSGSFGTTDRSTAGMPPAAPDFSRPQDNSGAPIPAPALGVSQQISLLEREVFRKSYDRETILNRLSRLESTVFPQAKPAADKSLPERMNRLLAAVPLSQASADTAPARKRRGGDPDFPDLDFGSPGSLSSSQKQMPGQGGLSKIINGLGNALTGGSSGSYTTPGHLITDPSTGLLYDQYTGTLIDPMTGAVVGRRNMGGSPYPAYGGFNSGLSPVTPYGGMGFGFGGSGLRMGGWP